MGRRRRLDRCTLVLWLVAGCSAVTLGAAAEVPKEAAPQPLARLNGPSGLALNFSSDGDRLLTASAVAHQVWDCTTWRPLGGPVRHGGDPLTLADLSPDGRLVLTAAGGEARVWDAATGEPRHPPLAHGGPLRVVAFSPDGSTVLTAGGHTVRTWDARTGAPLRSFDDAPAPISGRVPTLHSAEFAADGTTIVAVIADRDFGAEEVVAGRAMLWDAETGRLRGAFDVDVWPLNFAEFSLSAAALSPDGSRLVTRSMLGIEVRDPRTGDLIDSPHTHCNDASAHVPPFPIGGPPGWIAFAPGPAGRWVTTGWRADPVLWDPGDLGRPAILRERSKGGATRAEFTADGGRVLLAGGMEGTFVIDVATRKTVLSVPQDPAVRRAPAVALSPDGAHLAVAYKGRDVTDVYGVPAEGP